MLSARAAQNIEPAAERLRLPAAYGAPTDTALMPWTAANARLAQASHCAFIPHRAMAAFRERDPIHFP